MSTNLYWLTIHQAQTLLRSGQISSVELTQALLDRILAIDNDVRAYLSLLPEEALAQAEAADRRRAAGDDTPLLGIPLAIKDVHLHAGRHAPRAARASWKTSSRPTTPPPSQRCAPPAP